MSEWTEAAWKAFGLDDPTTGVPLDCVRLRNYSSATKARKKAFDQLLGFPVGECEVYSYNVRVDWIDMWRHLGAHRPRTCGKYTTSTPSPFG